MFVKLQGRLVLVVGGGIIAAGKIPGLLQAQARVRVVAPQINPEISAWVGAREIEWTPKEFAPSDLEGAHLVIAATSLQQVNAAVFQQAESRGIFCNAVDDIANCRFYYGSIVQRGDLQIVISTNGKSPLLLSECVKNSSSNIQSNTERGSISLAKRASSYAPVTHIKRMSKKTKLSCIASLAAKSSRDSFAPKRSNPQIRQRARITLSTARPARSTSLAGDLAIRIYLP